MKDDREDKIYKADNAFEMIADALDDPDWERHLYGTDKCRNQREALERKNNEKTK